MSYFVVITEEGGPASPESVAAEFPDAISIDMEHGCWNLPHRYVPTLADNLQKHGYHCSQHGNLQIEAEAA